MTTQVKGVRVSVSVYFAAVLTLVCIMSEKGHGAAGLICCILHEFGHLLFMKLFGVRVKAISFGIYGMRIDASAEPFLSPLKEALVASGGPVVNCLLFIVGFIIGDKLLMTANAVLGAFNLLPVESMDGYNFLFNFLRLYFDEDKIKAALRIVSAAFLLVIYCFGFLVLFKSRYNFTVLAVAVYLTFRFLH